MVPSQVLRRTNPILEGLKLCSWKIRFIYTNWRNWDDKIRYDTEENLKDKSTLEKVFLHFLLSDRSSEIMKVSKRNFVKILNIYWVIKVLFLSQVRLWRQNCLNWNLDYSLITQDSRLCFGNLDMRWIMSND